MARNQSETKPDCLLKCPHCGNEDTFEMRWKEMIPCTYRFSVSEGKIIGRPNSANVDYEGAQDECIFCNNCYQPFDCPDEFEATWE